MGIGEIMDIICALDGLNAYNKELFALAEKIFTQRPNEIESQQRLRLLALLSARKEHKDSLLCQILIKKEQEEKLQRQAQASGTKKEYLIGNSPGQLRPGRI